MSNFQIILTGLFVFFIILGVILFAGLKSSSTQSCPEIVVWGTVNGALFNQFLQSYNADLPDPLKVQYVEKTEADFHKNFIEALANGKSPDAILLPQDLIAKEYNKLFTIPFSTFSERQFKDTFIQEAELYLAADGSLALPFAVDPLVMYWNRDLLAYAGLATYPRTWNDILTIAKKVTTKDTNSNVFQSGVALGEYRNITHAKDILATLFMQAGTPIVQNTAHGLQSAVDKDFGYSPRPAEAALAFYSQFADPNKDTFSWNRALPESKKLFISGDLAVYFGFASELADIRTKNPQLNFDVAPVPQSKTNPQVVTFGRMYGFAIPRISSNSAAAYSVLSHLVTPEALSRWSALTYLPPVRRDMLLEAPKDPFMAVFYSAALVARGWLDPSATETGIIFQSMLENVMSGKETAGEAVTRGSNEIDNLIPQQ